MKSKRMRRLAVGAAVLVGVLAAGEAMVRWGGYVDLPVYDANARIGYIPKANQRGSFMNENDWVINEKHMGAEAWAPNPVSNLLLVGDSIVWGGNPYKREDRLGPQVQRQVQGKVWPIAAGSWGLQNELTYLNDNPDVVTAASAIVFVSNSGDFDQPSSWGCSWSHPLARPVSGLWFLTAKYALRLPCEGTPAALKVPPQDPLAMLADFMRRMKVTDKPVIFVLYPDAEEFSDPALRRSRLESIAPQLTAAGVQQIVRLGDDAAWQGTPDRLYRDGIHPTPEGMYRLARAIVRALPVALAREAGAARKASPP